MNFRFWKPKYSVCSECGVHFEPVTGYESRWGNLCETHRKPVRERDEKKDAVMIWAAANWQRLSVIKDKEEAEVRQQYNQVMQERFAYMAASQQA